MPATLVPTVLDLVTPAPTELSALAVIALATHAQPASVIFPSDPMIRLPGVDYHLLR